MVYPSLLNAWKIFGNCDIIIYNKLNYLAENGLIGGITMQPYLNINGDSGVAGYEIGPDYIIVCFKNTYRLYRYSYRKVGKENVERMKILARNGDGLNSFINKYVKFLYD